MHVQSCCFAVAFSPLLLPSPSVNLPNNVIQKFCYYGNVTSHFSSLLASGINLLKSNVGSFVYFNKTALSSHPLRFTLGFRFKILKNLFNKIRNKLLQFVFLPQKPFPLFTSGDFYVKLSIDTCELNFLTLYFN